MDPVLPSTRALSPAPLNFSQLPLGAIPPEQEDMDSARAALERMFKAERSDDQNYVCEAEPQEAAELSPRQPHRSRLAGGAGGPNSPRSIGMKRSTLMARYLRDPPGGKLGSPRGMNLGPRMEEKLLKLEAMKEYIDTVQDQLALNLGQLVPRVTNKPI